MHVHTHKVLKVDGIQWKYWQTFHKLNTVGGRRIILRHIIYSSRHVKTSATFHIKKKKIVKPKNEEAKKTQVSCREY